MRELCNDIARILRETEAGETFTVTVRGRPVARIVPACLADRPRVDVDRATLRRILAQPVDDGLAADLDAAEAPLDEVASAP
ncbi:MAG: type II toxin-antitoxin system Phd/YefM family antitoxin [Thermoleophilia bacterium]